MSTKPSSRGSRRMHNPKGPTEEHLVEELAGIIWRKRRLRLAEAAVHHRGLQEARKPPLLGQRAKFLADAGT
jgi:hypothetical protein